MIMRAEFKIPSGVFGSLNFNEECRRGPYRTLPSHVSIVPNSIKEFELQRNDDGARSCCYCPNSSLGPPDSREIHGLQSYTVHCIVYTMSKTICKVQSANSSLCSGCSLNLAGPDHIQKPGLPFDSRLNPHLLITSPYTLGYYDTRNLTSPTQRLLFCTFTQQISASCKRYLLGPSTLPAVMKRLLDRPQTVGTRESRRDRLLSIFGATEILRSFQEKEAYVEYNKNCFKM